MSEEDQYGVPDNLKVKRRPYTMTREALAARQRNAQLSTGPKSEEGKKASSRNAWKHGLYAQSFIMGLGKPCQTTCEKYLSCDLVSDGGISPGESCLDKQFVAEAFDKIILSIQDKKHDGFNNIAAMELAGALQVLREMKKAILDDGIVVKSEKQDKDGHTIGHEYKPHPALAVYTKMLVDLGITFKDFNMTPREIARAEKGLDEDEKNTAASIMSKAISNLARGAHDGGNAR